MKRQRKGGRIRQAPMDFNRPRPRLAHGIPKSQGGFPKRKKRRTEFSSRKTDGMILDSRNRIETKAPTERRANPRRKTITQE